jgi:hypothetical protein
MAPTRAQRDAEKQKREEAIRRAASATVNIGPVDTSSSNRIEVHFEKTFEESVRSNQRAITLVVNGDREYDDTHRSSVKSYESRALEIQRVDLEHPGTTPKLPALTEDSVLFTRLVESTKQTFSLFRMLVLRLEAGISESGSKPAQDTNFRKTMAGVVKMGNKVLGIMEVMKEACIRKIPLTFLHEGDVFMRLETLHRYLQLVQASKTQIFTFWDEFMNIAEMICDFRVKQDTVDCEHGKLESLLFDTSECSEESPPVRGDDQHPLSDDTTTTAPRAVFVTSSSGSQAMDLESLVRKQKVMQDQINRLTDPDRDVVEFPADFQDCTEDGLAVSKNGYKDYINKNKCTPPFSGEEGEHGGILSWPTFWRNFRGMFHKFSYKTFPREFKLSGLMESTAGPAQAMVASFLNSPEEDAYDRCVRCLYMTYGAPDQSTAAVKAAMVAARPLTHSVTDIRAYLSRMLSYITTLMNLGESKYQAYLQGAEAIYAQLPAAVKGSFNGYYSFTGSQYTESVRKNPRGAFDRLDGWIRKNTAHFEGSRVDADREVVSGYDEWMATKTGLYLAANSSAATAAAAAAAAAAAGSASKSAPPVNEGASTSKPQGGFGGNQGGTPKGSKKRPSNAPGGGSDPKRANPNKHRCPFHQNSEHHANDCTYSVTERTNKVKEYRGCFNCLNTGHLLGNCRSPHRCKNCACYGNADQKHHTALCKKPVHKDFPKWVPRNQKEDAQLTPKVEAGAASVPAGNQAAVLAALLQGGSLSDDRLRQIKAIMDGPGDSKPAV